MLCQMPFRHLYWRSACFLLFPFLSDKRLLFPFLSDKRHRSHEHDIAHCSTMIHDRDMGLALRGLSNLYWCSSFLFFSFLFSVTSLIETVRLSFT